jgi:hypothetical protein
MPFGDYSGMADCISKNRGKDDPAAFCAWLCHDLTGKWPSQEDYGEVPAKVQKEEPPKTSVKVKI